MIELKDVNFSYDSVKPVLNNINLQIKCGEFVAVVGANGSGKSTLAKHLNGLLVPASGDVVVIGINTKDATKSLAVKQNVGMVFQNPDNQLVSAIVEEDVAFALENLQVPHAEMKVRVEEILEKLGILECRYRSVEELSGGQKQRVAVAGVLAMRPRFMVLDEPTAMLDPQGRNDVMALLKKLNSECGISILLITHFMEEAALAERLIVLNDGNVILEGAPKQVFGEVELLHKSGLLLPQITRFCAELKLREGWGIVDEDECVVELVKILEGS
ncbi:MAG: energy-coupling factor transporter ATPase [Oscillospiraceae bacterium]|jgi:energy-coupling factor transport system ATP-binding protein|nr:energy-coupling factor transporter ATPase [Oscillospiraceae bacterium]